MRCLLVALLGLAIAGPAHAGPAVLNVDQLRAFGQDALTKGFADQTLGIAEALLARDPADSAAMALQAQALRVLQRLPESEAAARAAWAAAKDNAQRYSAATAVAQALSLQNHRTTAQYWLRQAVQNAPNPAARSQALQDFNFVRDQNPLSLQFDASVGPSSNVNNGARDPFFRLGPFILQIPGEQQALSGVVETFGLSGKYRLAETQSQTTSLTFDGSAQMVQLSQASRKIAPFAANGDYAYETIGIGLERKLTFGTGTSLTFAAALGHDWYGGRDLSNHQSLTLDLDQPLAPDTHAFASLAVQHQNRLDSHIASSTATDLSLGVANRTANGDVIRLTVNLDRTRSDAIGVDHSGLGASLDWQHAKPVLGMGLAASLGVARTDYQKSSFTFDGRHDVQVTASLSATLNKIGYLGFSPVLSVTYARNTSNIPFDNTRTFGLGLSVKSRF